jgi:hypothetical protein
VEIHGSRAPTRRIRASTAKERRLHDARRMRFLLVAFLVAGCNDRSLPGTGSGGGGSDAGPAADAATDAASPSDLSRAPDLAGTFCGGFAGLMCATGQYCEFPGGTCGGADEPGSCAPEPTECGGASGPPACGCDGKTYDTDCARRAAGVALKQPGRCDGTCGGDGDCANGQLCCPACGIPGCTAKQCLTPVNGACPPVPGA